MSLLYPLGLLGLLGIPVLILIYIIKNKYTEKTISSTYLWNLSETFLKRRTPVSKIVGIISLVLQILAVLFLSVAVARPVFYLKNAAGAYCFVLDGSGSMNVVENGKTRFEAGKDNIRQIVEGSVKGSTYTLVYAGAETETVFEDYADKEGALSMLDGLETGYCESGLDDALSAAQNYFRKNPAAKTYLVTDKTYESCENITLLNVASAEHNHAVGNVTFEEADGVTVRGEAVSYTEDAVRTLTLTFDDDPAPYATQQIELTAGERTGFIFETARTEFRSFRVAFTEEDALPLDDGVTVYNTAYENSSRTLLVTDSSSFLLEAALRAAGNTRLDRATSAGYAESGTGYDLYVFDGVVPAAMPTDGAVWFVNPKGSVAGSYFSFRAEISSPEEDAKFSDSTSTRVRALLQGLRKEDVALAKYLKCGLDANFSVLATCEGNPVIFAGTNAYGNREVVFAFSLGETDFAMQFDFQLLMGNLSDYCFPDVIEQTSYICGESMRINVLAGCDSIVILTPLGNRLYPDTSVDVSEYRLDEVGTYTVTMTLKDGTSREIGVYAVLPEAERAPAAVEERVALQGTAGGESPDGIYDDLIAVFAILAVLAAADFGVYCYEQYQLR